MPAWQTFVTGLAMPNKEHKGSVRVVSCRKEKRAVVATAQETLVMVDRTNPVLGNRYVLENFRDGDQRDAVITAYKNDLDRDIDRGGPMFQELKLLAARVAGGERIALCCWCAPRKCHADFLTEKIKNLAGIEETKKIEQQDSLF